MKRTPLNQISTNFKLINDNDFVEEEDNEFSIEDPFGNEEELIEETSTGEGYTLDEFMENHS